MTVQVVLDSLNKLSLMDLYKVQNDVSQAIQRQSKSLIGSVSMKKNDQGTVYLKHPTNGTYICKQVAYHGRWRMWKMVQGQRGLKCGNVVVKEHIGDLDSLKIQVALGYYKG